MEPKENKKNEKGGGKDKKKKKEVSGKKNKITKINKSKWKTRKKKIINKS